MTGRSAVLLLAVAVVGLALSVPPAAAQQQDITLYLTDETGSAAGQSGVRLLSPTAPTGDPTTETLTPASGGSTLSWYGANATLDDQFVTGTVTVDLFFGAGLDVDATTNVSLYAVGAGPDVLLGGAEASGVAGGAPHSQSFNLEAAGAVVPEGAFLRLDVSVSGNALAVNLQFGGDGAQSAITSLPLAVVDSDGDGVGDSEERRQGSDPQDASSTPGDPGDPDGNGTLQDPDAGQPGNDDGGGSGGGASGADDASPPVEAVLGAFLLLICLAVGGVALNRRFA